MPLHYDVAETEVYQKREEDEDMKELWNELMKDRSGEATCTECGEEYDEDEYDECPECGSVECKVTITPDPLWVLSNGVFSKKGGKYGQRGAQNLEGEYPYIADKETLKEVLDEYYNEVPEKWEELIPEALEGMKVWATR